MEEKEIGQLIDCLRNECPLVRKRAVDELSRLDDEHALTALHWAMRNELDEEIRLTAKKAYERLRALHVREEEKEEKETPITKFVETVIEVPPNLFGSWSLRIACISIVLLMVGVLLAAPYMGKPPMFVQIIGHIGRFLPAAGVFAGIVGVVQQNIRKIGAITGLTINLVILILGILRLVGLI